MSVGETPYTSILYLTAARNRFYKARLTAPKKSPALPQDERLASIEHDLGDLITNWIYAMMARPPNARVKRTRPLGSLTRC